MRNARTHIACLVVAPLVFAMPASAQDAGTAGTAAGSTAAKPFDPKAAADGLSPMVEDVQVVGPWSEGSQSGIWRTIMLKSPEKENGYRFYVQQLSGDGASLSLKSSTEIKEINTIDGAVVGYRADEPSPDATNDLTLFFDVVPKDAEIAETYQLHFFADAPYDFGPATN